MIENVVRLLGVLTRDADISSTHSLRDRVVLQLATRRRWTNRVGEHQEATDHHRVVVYGPLTLFARTLRRGEHIGISGRLQTRSWMDSGARKFLTEVIAERIRRIGPHETSASRPLEP